MTADSAAGARPGETAPDDAAPDDAAPDDAATDDAAPDDAAPDDMAPDDAAPDGMAPDDAPPLDGVLETALYVRDLDRSEQFWRALLGARTLLADDRMRALDVAGRQVLLLFVTGGSDRPSEVPGGTIPPHDGQGRLHLAFAIPRDALEPWERRLTTLGVAVETRVRPPRGGICLYFRDPDGHLVELATPGVWPTY